MKKTIIVAAILCVVCLFGCAQETTVAVSEPESTTSTLEATEAALTPEAQPETEGAALIRDNAGCLECHGAADYRELPEDHAGRTSDMCLNCHGTSYLNNTTGAPFVPHNLHSASEVDWPNE